MGTMKSLSAADVKITDGFWRQQMDLMEDVVIPFQEDKLHDRDEDSTSEPSGAIRNFRIAAGLEAGEYHGMVFQDSDVAKWLEAVAYSLMDRPDDQLQSRADEVIDLIGQAQHPDGYLNTYFTIKEPNKRWTNLRRDHELYCAGHMLEAAVAYYEATGRRKLLDIMIRMVDHIDQMFGPEEHKRKGYPGHEEIELALFRLYNITNDPKHFGLAKYFLDQRGQEPHYYEIEAAERGETQSDYVGVNHSYSQAHLPVRQQNTAEGHSVRAMYLFSAMADLAAHDDAKMAAACRTLWDNVVNRRMYVTGGVGSIAHGEAFTVDYDLPSDLAYTETCAAIGLAFWARRMLNLELNGEYADVMERALYNGVISGISQDGRKFFYVNPLAVWPDAAEHRHDHRHVKTERQGWFGCACCPPNLARAVASIGHYMYASNDEQLAIHLYGSSKTQVEFAGTPVAVTQTTQYPWDGSITIAIDPTQAVQFQLLLRCPGWAQQVKLLVNGEEQELQTILQSGYLVLERTWAPGDQVQLMLGMEPHWIYADPQIRAASGRVALQRGPIVYCLEEVDNGSNLDALVVPAGVECSVQTDNQRFPMPIPIIQFNVLREQWPTDGSPYSSQAPQTVIEEATAVPYFLWNNRGRGELTVWLRQQR